MSSRTSAGSAILAAPPPFREWKLLQDLHPSQNRQYDDVYDPVKAEKYPPDLWYEINQPNLNQEVGLMFKRLLDAIKTHPDDDTEIIGLIATLEKARKLPALKAFLVAVVGDQNIGKSTILNAIFHRELLDYSGGSKACTLVATIIKYRVGAADNCTTSDVKVEFISKNYIPLTVQEHWNCYEDVFIREREVGEDGEQELTKEKKEAGETAREFFELILGRRGFANWTRSPDIGNSRFIEACVKEAEKRITELKEKDGVAHFTNVQDKDLMDIYKKTNKIWPLVKVIEISTGHVLLRNGVWFVDIPGRGDFNSTRNAMSRKFCEKADVELVVSANARLETSSLQHDYLAESVARRGPNNTILIANKSDLLLNNIDFDRQIRQIEEHPFTALLLCMTEAENLLREGREDPSLLRAYMRLLYKVAKLAYIERNGRQLKRQMRDKNIKMFQVSAAQYMMWTKRIRIQEPELDPDATGIPALRRLLFQLPADNNYRAYYDHIFSLLPQFQEEANTVNEKYTGDKSYAAMRAGLNEEIPELKRILKQQLDNKLVDLVVAPWNKEVATYRQVSMVRTTWRDPKYRCNTFEMMLRNYGLAVRGKKHGANLNMDLLGTWIADLKNWRASIPAPIECLRNSLGEDVQVLLTGINKCIDESSADPMLKHKALAALARTRTNISKASIDLTAEMTSVVRSTYTKFTTETDVKCPIAQGMRVAYVHAQDVLPGQGKFNRHRARILEDLPTLPEKVGRRFVDRVESRTKKLFGDFVAEVIDQLEDFARVTAALLKTNKYATSAHQRTRQRLKEAMVKFQADLAKLHRTFPVKEVSQALVRTRKRSREARDAEYHMPWTQDAGAAPSNDMRMATPAQIRVLKRRALLRRAITESAEDSD